MTIDVIDYTPEQFAELTVEQVEEVKNVQQKKNRLADELAEKKRKQKYKLVDAGIFRSAIYEKICAALDESYEREIERLRSGLLFYLQYTSKSESANSAPYEVDYAYSFEERYEIVKTYYEGAYSDGKERLAAFKQDKTAAAYLGEYYGILYDYFAMRV